MKYLVTIFLLFILFSIIKCQPPRCLYSDIYAKSPHPNLIPSVNYVNWWIYEHFNDAGNGGSSFYTDSNLKDLNEKIFELSDYDMRDQNQESPITQTFSQVNDLRFSSISYNNAFDDNYSTGSAHEKGFFIWNEEGGIHVIHSIPHTPQTMDGFFLHTSKDKYLQHSICITLLPAELDIIPKFLIYTNPAIGTINSKVITGSILSALTNKSTKDVNNVDTTDILVTVTDDNIIATKQFTEIDTIIEGNFIVDNFIVGQTLPRIIKILQWAKLARHVAGNIEFSSDLDPNLPSYHYYRAKKHSFGEYFVQTPIPEKRNIIAGTSQHNLARMNNIEILWQYIGKYYSSISKWMSQTMTSNKGFANNVVPGNNVDTTFSLTFKLNYPFLNDHQQRSASKDHSKFMYGTSNNGQQKIFCIGGLNWQRVQESRGGAAFCMDGIGYLVDYMKRHVSWTRKGIAQDQVKSGVPQSTAGTEIDFSWIEDQLNIQKLYIPMGFEILIPTTQNPLPKRVIEPAQSNYKTKNAPLLVEPVQTPLGALSYKSEAISIDVFPSVKDKVHICLQSSQCPYELSAKFNIISNINLIVTPYQRDSQSDPVMTITSNPIPAISVSQVLKNNYFSSMATEKIIQLSGNNFGVYLQKTQQTLDDFKFQFPQSSINTPCTISPIGNDISIMFHETCVDQLIFCLFSHFHMYSIQNNNIPVFMVDDQASFYNDVTQILNEFFPNIPDISRCVEQPPSPGTAMTDNDEINEVMGSQAMTDEI
ncbi:hypothetical protein DDB_G0290837 [Dictyostelium discoideum AX4]|uniref:Uncharacterized protein n=1 Tax=Dictyostelium discoideum TaxID=44689 RepID=Q54FI9_DICDI|nr:hypothetical protein DDB_G0290837 [Dictyostelium discoideum AX4]EAL62052.1 hypothetical protein DDB_G0290837 [Dictyostelium discoideum AX4]|eukprot:XP_635551.1 hypothetical protein DDB_G0290837 [Dictyostelium discoideum AX4]